MQATQDMKQVDQTKRRVEMGSLSTFFLGMAIMGYGIYANLGDIGLISGIGMMIAATVALMVAEAWQFLQNPHREFRELTECKPVISLAFSTVLLCFLLGFLLFYGGTEPTEPVYKETVRVTKDSAPVVSSIILG